MKKNLLYLFTVLCTMSFFTACGDDDPVDESWKTLSATYQGDKLDLTVNEIVSTTGTVTVNATDAESATITLNNMVPDDKAVEINAVLSKSEKDHNLSGETTINGATLKINGTIKEGVMTLSITRTVSSVLSGLWKVKMTETGAAVVANIVTGDPARDAQLAAIPAQLGGLMAQKVKSVSVNINTNGIVAPISWVKADGTTAGMPDLVTLQYVVKDNQLLLAIDKNLVTLAATLLPSLGININIQSLTAMLIDLGGYYAFPINYKQENNETTFYVNKAQLVALLPVMVPIIESITADKPVTPESQAMLTMLGTLAQIIPNAQTAEVGLVFTK